MLFSRGRWVVTVKCNLKTVIEFIKSFQLEMFALVTSSVSGYSFREVDGLLQFDLILMDAYCCVWNADWFLLVMKQSVSISYG